MKLHDFSIISWTAWVVCLALFSGQGCRGAYDYHRAVARYHYKGEMPGIIDAEGLLSAEGNNAIIERLKGGIPAERLRRYFSQIEALTGSTLISGNKAVLLCDGPDTFAAMEKAILGARDHINVETFIFRDDEVGTRIAGLLMKKSLAGVVVNFIYDSWGAKYTDPAFFQRLRDNGINTLEFNSIEDLGAFQAWSIDNRDHRKILVVDGKVAFTGGINFYRVYAGSSGAKPRHKKEGEPDYFWRDMHIQIEGPAVAEFQRIFLGMWKRGGKRLAEANYFPTLRNRGPLLMMVLTSAPDQRVPKIYVAYVSAIQNAKKTIHLTHAYFAPDRDFLDALTGAARRGVDVKIILPSFSDSWLTINAARSFYSDLLSAGVKIYERKEALLHSKTAVIDGVWSTVGSSNLDARSFLHDAEINAVVFDRDFGAEMEQVFDHDLAQSDEITLEKWEKRPFMDRIRERTARLFRYFL